MSLAVLLNGVTAVQIKDNLLSQEEAYIPPSYDELQRGICNILFNERTSEKEFENFVENYDSLNSDDVITMCAIGVPTEAHVSKLEALSKYLVMKSRTYDYAPPRSFGYVLHGVYKEIYSNPMWD